ncbi:cilia- and flagella-associated protein 337 isoform X2 [Hydra vulgaris]|uniref:WD repeat-containing protein on Y chromosome n=1 Tax=Hydra vulgaris TaxID=6087 RepID=A0ABM4CKN1_HYDVU
MPSNTLSVISTKCNKNSSVRNGEETRLHEKTKNKMSNQNLTTLQTMFQSSDQVGMKGGLNMEEFGNAINIAFGQTVGKKELENLFLKVDRNCDGKVDWEEFCSYVLFENEQILTINNESADSLFPKRAKELSHPHHDTIVMLGYLPTLGGFQKGTKNGIQNSLDVDNYDNTYGRYISVSKDGLFVFWNLDFQLQRVVHLSDSIGRKPQQMWVTDVACLSNVKKVAVSTTDRHILFYDCSGNNFDIQFIITGLDHCVFCMDYWYDASDLNNSCLLLGDANGSISCITFTLATVGLFDFSIGKEKDNTQSNVRKISFQELVGNRHTNVGAITFHNLHKNWVRKVRYISILQCFISCANCASSSLLLVDLQSNKIKTSFKIDKGVYTFDYDKENNVIVTGGLDCTVRLWNPYVGSKASSVLKGHNSAVVHVIVYDQKIISFSRDKIIKVWNTRDHSCLQTIPNCVTETGGVQPFTTVYFNKNDKTLLLGSNTILVLGKKEKNLEKNNINKNCSHSKPLCGALYNPLYNQVVSACHGSVINIWNVLTGENVLSVSNAHEGSEITAILFDKTMKKLITGSANGVVKTWNFSNGDLVREIKALDGNEVTGLACPNQNLVVVGWNHRIQVYHESEDTSIKIFNSLHKDDVLSIDSLETGVAVTSSYDGQVSCWNLKTGEVSFEQNINTLKKKEKESGIEATTTEAEAARTLETMNKEKVKNKIVSIEKVLILKSREDESKALTILFSADKNVQAWSSKNKFLGQFDALDELNDGSIHAMISDSKNNLLFIGDSLGIICIWDISDCFFIHSTITLKEDKKKFEENKPQICLKFRAHFKAIVSLDYIENTKNILSASTDCCARLWTIKGVLLGTFGQMETFNTTENIFKQNLVLDFQSSSPAMTSKVLKVKRKWRLINIIIKFLYSKNKENAPLVSLLKNAPELNNFSAQNLKLLLGKNYRPNRHHRSSKLIKIKFNQLQCIVFSSLELAKLSSVEKKTSQTFASKQEDVKQQTTSDSKSMNGSIAN